MPRRRVIRLLHFLNPWLTFVLEWFINSGLKQCFSLFVHRFDTPKNLMGSPVNVKNTSLISIQFNSKKFKI